MNQLPMFTRSYAEQLRTELASGKTLLDYYQPIKDYPQEFVMPSMIKVPDTAPELSPDISEDVNNSIKLYEYLTNMDKTQASDKRLWVYLSHVTFREYTIDRWGIKVPSDELSVNKELQKRTITYLLEHWFVGSNDRSMRRHSLARLWWAAYLTVAPWEQEPEYFAGLSSEDRFVYTKILFASQDIYQQVLERGLGRSNHILIAILEFLRQNPELQVRENMRMMMKELNLTLGYRQLDPLSFDELLEVVKEAATSPVPMS
jgi:hypothetical protein